MGKKKMSFEEMVILRKENHDEFIKTIFNNCLNHVFFDGELMLKSYREIEKDGKTITVHTDKWIMFNEDEKKTLIDMAKERCEKEKAEILRECDERYARAETHPYRGVFMKTISLPESFVQHLKTVRKSPIGCSLRRADFSTNTRKMKILFGNLIVSKAL